MGQAAPGSQLTLVKGLFNAIALVLGCYVLPLLGFNSGQGTLFLDITYGLDSARGHRRG